MRWFTISVLALAACLATAARGDIYQWEYIDPLQPELGRQQSSTLAPDGAGRNAWPAAALGNLDLTMAWLHEMDLHVASFKSTVLTDADLSVANLTNAYLGNATLTGADFTGADLRAAYLENATLTGADFTGAEVRGASFYSTTDSGFSAAQLYSTASYQAGDLTGIDLNSNDLTGWDFAGQDLTRASCGWATLTDADFTGAVVREAMFSSTTDSGFTAAQLYSTASYQAGDLSGIGLGGNDLTRWNFAGQNLTGVSFSGATLTDADLSAANLTGADFGPSHFTAGATLTGADLRSANLTSASFRNATLTNAALAGANLASAYFYDATLTGADFTGAVVRGTNFDSTTDFTVTQLYSTASYQASDLRGIVLGGNDLAGWDFAGQDLTSARISDATLTGANLAGANLTNADFSNATLTGADFTGAVVRGTNFDSTTDFTVTQLYSTASYQGRDLAGIRLVEHDLTGWNFAGQNLTSAWLSNATLTGADFTGAEVRGASFYSTTDSGFSAAQLYSTASYQARDLTGIRLPDNDLTGWDFAGQNLTDAVFRYATLTGADFTSSEIRGASFYRTTGFTAAQLYSTASYQAGDLAGIDLSYNDLTGWDFAGQDLTNAWLSNATLTGADFTGAMVRGASFRSNTDSSLTAVQLYSTASYQLGDLAGIRLGGNDLTDWDLAGQNLFQSRFDGTTLTNVDLRGANLAEADFYRSTMVNVDLSGANLEWAQLGMHMTIANTDLHDANLRYAYFQNAKIVDTTFAGANLSGVTLWQYSKNLMNVDFSGVNLIAAVLVDEGRQFHSGLDFTGADARGALIVSNPELYFSSELRNFIGTTGRVAGLHVLANETLRLWDLNPNLVLSPYLLYEYEIPLDDPLFDPIGDIPILVEESMSIDPSGTLRIVFEDDQWGSTITFEPGIPVSLNGTLELLFDDDANAASLVGTTYQLFDWTGVEPEGQFEYILSQNGLLWNTGRLYTTGEVTLIGAVPEPSSVVLLVAGLGLAAWGRRRMNCLVACLIVTAAAVSLLSENAAAQTVNLPGWRLVWQDEFDAAGVDTSKWQVLTRQNSYNEEKQYYLPQQASIVDGHLRITATDQSIGDKQYRSARLESWQAFGPGRFEARIDLPTGQGMWPAFWLFPNDPRIPWPTGGEIDILENRGSQPERVGSAYHWQVSPGPCCGDAHYVFGEHIAFDESGLVNFHEGFHVYAAEWEEDEIRFFVDGELSYTVRETSSRPVFETPKNIILNLAVGGLFGGDPDLTTVFPQVMDVDYVRVWEAVPEPSGWKLLALFSLAITCHYRMVRS